VVQEIEQIVENKIEAKKDILTTKEYLLITKEDLIDRIHRSKIETIAWIVGVSVLEFVGSILAFKFLK